MSSRFVIPLASIGIGAVLALTAYGMGYRELECTREAALRKLDAENEMYRTFYGHILYARSLRRHGVFSAWYIADDQDRKDRLRRVDDDYDDMIKRNTRDQKDAEKKIKREYDDDIKACRDEQKNRCKPIKCERGSVPSCDSEGNPINYSGDACESENS